LHPHSSKYIFLKIKKACAIVNKKFNLENKICDAIPKVCDEIIAGKLNEHFPLSVW